MTRIRIIPVLLLKGGGLYKTKQFKNPCYIGDPINTVKLFNDKEADELIILNYNISLSSDLIDFRKLWEIAGEAFMPMSYGGGISSLDDAKRIFDAGFEKVIINSSLFDNIQLINDIAGIYGSQAVVGGIDFRKNIFGIYKVYSNSGIKNTGYHPIEWAKKLEENGVGEIFINSIDRDGMWCGYDEEIIKCVSESVSVPVVCCGGASCLNDLSRAVEAGASAVAAGSLFVYQKKGMGVLVNFPTTLKLVR